MKILMLSYIDIEREGRLSRCYHVLSKEYEICLIQNSEKPSQRNIKNLVLTSSNPVKRYFEFCRKLLQAAKEEEYDCIYAHNYFTALPALMLKRKRPVKVVYDAYELYYPEGKEVFTKRDYFYYFFEKRIIRKANAVIAANKERALLMTGYYRLKRIPFIIDNVPSEEPEIYYSNHIQTGRLNLVYAGYLSEERRIIDLVHAVIRRAGEFRLTIYGTGELGGEIEHIAAEHECIQFKGAYDNDNLGYILKDYDIGFLSYPNTDFNNIFCSPNKIYDYIFRGLVILGTNNYKLKQFVSEHGYGVCSDNIDAGLSDLKVHYKDYKLNLMNYLNGYKWDNGIADELRNIMKVLDE